MLISYKRGQSSVILRVKIRDSSQSDGRGLTGLTNASSGLTISTIADNESSPTSYTVAGSTIETISTLGTFAAPSANKCRFKEVSSTLHRGVYEIQIADARYAASGAKSLLVSISGATNAAECDVVIPLTDTDPYDAAKGGMTNLDATISGRLATTHFDTITGAPAASIAADIAAVKSDTGTILTDVNTGAGAIYTRLGAPAGASIAADIAEANADTDELITTLGAAGAGLTALPAMTLTSGERNTLAAVILRRTMPNVQNDAAGDAVNKNSLYGFIQQAQKSSVSGGTLTIQSPDGSTLGTLTLTSSAGANPVTGVS